MSKRHSEAAFETFIEAPFLANGKDSPSVPFWA